MNHRISIVGFICLTQFLSLAIAGCLRPGIRHSVRDHGYGGYADRSWEPRFIEAKKFPESLKPKNTYKVSTITIKVLRGDSPPRELALELGQKRGCDFIVMKLEPYAQYEEYDHNEHINPSDRYSYVQAQFNWE